MVDYLVSKLADLLVENLVAMTVARLAEKLGFCLVAKMVVQ